MIPKDKEKHQTIYDLYKKIKVFSTFGIIDVIPSMVNIVIVYDNQMISIKKLFNELEKIINLKLVNEFKPEENYEYEISMKKFIDMYQSILET